MAKINHNNAFETINNWIEHARKSGAIHLYAQDDYLTGKELMVNGKKCYHFATTGYLGLEQDMRIKSAAADAIMKFGTQFPLSKTYISHPLYKELEDVLLKMFGVEIIVCKNSTLAHLGVIPQAVGDDDVVILDHQVHWSVQHACAILKSKGIPIHMIRHNHMDQLEDWVKHYQNKKVKVWYMADGIYSMYGDKAPIEQLKMLSNKYKHLHLYFDDVHGMSWIGKNGTGFVLDKWGELTNEIIIVTTLSKTFGASGAVVLCGDRKLHQQIKNYGGPLTFSAQLEPSAVAAAIASAKIHLSEEIYSLQNSLANKILLMKKALQKTNLPLISYDDTPVFFIGTSLPDTAYNLVTHLLDKGFFVNPGIYPAVPMKNAGLRITISNHNEENHILQFIETLNQYFPIALDKTNNSFQNIQRHFKLAITETKKEHQTAEIIWENYKTIDDIEADLWNMYIGKYQAFDYEGMQWIEEAFTNLSLSSPNHTVFQYIMGKDKLGQVVGITSISEARWKEDVLANEKVSNKIEKIRESNPLFLTSLTMSLGSGFTEGQHMYLHQNHKEALNSFLNYMDNVFLTSSAEKLILRDFEENLTLETCLITNGYIKVQMPDTAIWEYDEEGIEDLIRKMSKKNRRNMRKEIIPFLETYQMECKQHLCSDDLDKAYNLYVHVNKKNRAINNFTYEKEIFEKMNAHKNWYFITAKSIVTNELLGVLFCYRNAINQSFNPILAGLTNNEEERLKVYRQLLFHTRIFGIKLQAKKSYMGLSAIFEKKKLGAKVYQKFAYIIAKDTYKQDLMSIFE